MKRSDKLEVYTEESTLLSNERTLLAYIRTFFSATILAFILFRFLEDKFSLYLGFLFFFIGLVFLIVGVYYYILRRRKFQSKK